jgi:hypothetical protein
MFLKVTLVCLKMKKYFCKLAGEFFSVFGMVEAETQRQATQHDCNWAY